MHNSVDLSYDQISVGHEFGFSRVITQEDVQSFATLTGDMNPLHMDPEYAKTTRFGERIVHGMLAGSLFSTLVGMLCPGKRNLYLSQSLEFRHPLKIGCELQIKGKISQKMDAGKIIFIDTSVVHEGKVAISGKARVMVL